MHRRVLTALALAGLATGCGGGGTTTPPAATPSPAPTSQRPEPTPEPRAPDTAAVDIVDFDYAPDPVQIIAGDSVVWTNRDSTSHTVSLRDGSVESGVVMSGATFTATFSTAGTFEYYCKFHPGSMVATVVVAAG